MAGSRLEKIGSIFTRMSGLLRSGAVKEVDKPLWYEIYAAFPPQQPPVYNRPEPTETVTEILYAEDLIRAKFYQVYGNPDVVDIQNEKVKTTCQKFVERYLELLEAGKDKDSLFELATKSLRDEGARLLPVLEMQKNLPKSSPSVVPKPATMTAEQVFGAVARKRPDDSDEYRDYDRDDHR